MTLSEQSRKKVEETARQYDLLPYESKPYTQSQPARMAATARMFGLDAAPVKRARVLELGCASGGNLLPLAVRFPQAEFLGLDISPRQIEEGKKRVEYLGLGNLKLLCKSFTDLSEADGTFDYIICHGVFSWVPHELQEAIFRAVKQRLSEPGIAFISYNVLPGWRLLQPMRDAFLSAIPPELEGEEKVRAAIDLARFLREANGSKSVYAQAISEWIERFQNFKAHYIAHEYMEDTNEPTTFRAFAERARSHGLGFLGEADFQGMVSQNYHPKIAAEIEARSGGDLVSAEQIIDLITGRTFRQSLLVHDHRLPSANRNLAPECINGLNLGGMASIELRNNDENATLWIEGKEAFIVKSKAMQKALQRFIARHPGTCRIEELAENEQDLSDVRKGFYSLVMSGAVTALAEPVIAASTLHQHPKAWSLALADARAGHSFIASLRHDLVELDPASLILLANMDGTVSQTELIEVLVEETLAGRITFYKDGAIAVSTEEAVQFARHHAPMVMARLARAALLTDDV